MSMSMCNVYWPAGTIAMFKRIHFSAFSQQRTPDWIATEFTYIASLPLFNDPTAIQSVSIFWLTYCLDLDDVSAKLFLRSKKKTKYPSQSNIKCIHTHNRMQDTSQLRTNWSHLLQETTRQTKATKIDHYTCSAAALTLASWDFCIYANAYARFVPTTDVLTTSFYFIRSNTHTPGIHFIKTVVNTFR